MLEEALTSSDVQSALENLEDYDLDYPIVRVRDYKTLQKALERDEVHNKEDLKRLLAVCVHDMPTMKYAATVINIIPAIVSKVKAGSYDPPPDLVPSAAAVINLLKTIALLGKVESLMSLCLDTLSTYPEDTLVILTEQHYEDVIETFNVCCHPRIASHVQVQVCNLLHKLLKILPREKKKVFVENGVSVWFSKIIPTVMAYMLQAHVTVTGTVTNIEILELLTENLIHVDYASNSLWHYILECICNTKQYPAIINKLLQEGSETWYRLWIVFIRLLKHQITELLSNIGTPINSMLPVVEAAFKLDIANRCRAFECWNVLIDSFSTETNESNINKRIRLLVIPLKSNNAKHEATALAKFKCWWHLITKFQNKMDKFLDMVLVTFLHFCFGKHNTVDKPVLVPGQLSTNLKKHCNEALVDMVGHVNCDGCTELSKLNGKIIDTKHLVDNWNHWIYSLTLVIMRTAKNDCGLTRQQIACLWKSFLMTIGELPENNIRKDLFAEILSIVAHLVQECKSNNEFLEITFNILILSLFEEETKIKQLLKSLNSPNDPIIRIVKIILDSSLHGFYNSQDQKELLSKFKLLTNLMLDEAVCTPNSIIVWLLGDLPTNDYALMLWAAMAESTYESNNGSSLLYMCDMMLWPLKSMNVFNKVQIPAITWHTTFDFIYPKLNKAEIDKSIAEILFSDPDVAKLSSSTVYFKLCVVLAILKQKFTENSCVSCEEEINLLLNLTKTINSYEFFESLMPMLVDRIVAILTIVTVNVNQTVTALILVCAKNVLHVLTQTCKQQPELKPVVDHIMLLVANLLKPLEILFAVESYTKLIPAMTYHLIRCSPLLSGHSSTRSIILSVMNAILRKTKPEDINYTKIQNAIREIVKKNDDLTSGGETFFIPQTKGVPKKTKRKEANIIDTVVENGEEYVVVKSNWRFNPRKLTENQKEKLQRKREDIPALYQDLSQSQDEFKLLSWKSDPQDTNSSSKSESKSCNTDNNETAEEILKNVPSTNVVPNILETILSENEKQSSKATELPPDNLRKVDISTPTNKNSKSPRLAFKDRVFRNVRNLIESSGVQKENKEATGVKIITEVVNKTPTSVKSLTSNSVNSAPPLLAADRPARVKRKPKKFEDLQLLTAKKSRSSLPDVQISQTHQSNNIVSSVKTIQNDNETMIQTSDNNEINTIQDCNHKVADIENGIKEQNTIEIGTKVSENSNASKSLEIDKNAPTAVTKPDEDVMDISLQKTLDDVREISIAKLSEDNNRVIAIDDNETTTCKKIVDETEVTTSNTSCAHKSLSTPLKANFVTQVSDCQDVTNSKAFKVTTPKLCKIGKSVANSEMKEASPIISKDEEITQDMRTPNTSKVDNFTTLQQPKEIKQISTKKSGTEIQKKLTNDVLKEVKVFLTKHQPKEIKEVSTPKQLPKQTTEILTPKQQLKEIKEVSTPKASPKIDVQKSTAKKNTVKKSSIEKELAIDTVEGHHSKEITEVSTPKQLPKETTEILTTKQQPKEIKEVSTPLPEIDVQKSTAKKNTVKKSGIEKELAIDTVESHPSKEVTEVTTPKQLSKETTEILTPKQQPKVIKEVSTPKASPKIDEQKSTVKKSTVKTSRIEKELAIDTVEGHPSKEVTEVSTPKASPKIDEQKSTVKKSTVKKSRIEKELAIDTVEGHPSIEVTEVSTPKQLPKETTEILTPKQQPKVIQEVSTPKASPKIDEQKSTDKKSTVKKSRIEKELAIDTVEGHPLLKIQSEKRLTRKALESVNSGRRKSLIDKLNKSKSGSAVSSLRSDKKVKDKGKETGNTSSSSSSSSVVVDESQEKNSEQTSFSDELPCSDDFIESSQDSTITTISVKSTRKTPNMLIPIVSVEKLTSSPKKGVDAKNSQSILDRVIGNVNKSLFNHESKDDTVLPLNKTALEEKSQEDLTENMDTEPLEQRDISDDVILVNDHLMTAASEETIISTKSQEVADTQPTGLCISFNFFKETMDVDENLSSKTSLVNVVNNHIPETCSEENGFQGTDKDQLVFEETVDNVTQHTNSDNTTITLSESAFIDKDQASGASSPFKDEIQRQQDFLNNTIEISPIKTMSPDRNKKSPSPETSTDYVVIKLTSPVHSNGEPFEKGSSPEVFTEDKVSPDKRDQSPPRKEITVANTSPSSSLSLKKNRPQVRSGGRGAQMLGLCVPEKVQSIMNPERNESEEVKKNTSNTPVRRNLRILYNSVGENTDSSGNGTSDNDDSENFLRFKKVLPAVDCSPSGPILKRKLVEITDDATVSPASKRKRVSFHDPPVSTTISVQKYIEPGAIRSPQNSANKRLERQLRQNIPQRSPKRLENAFNLDSVLTKTVESFTENEVITIPDDSQALSLDETPVAEVVRISELNNTDPICPDLLNCKDPIENIASELSSPAMKSLFIKELEGTIETIGDLAKLTELEVNRLCIKAPKVTVAKKVLMDYASKQTKILTIEEAEFAESMTESHTNSSNTEMQTDKIESSDMEMQTDEVSLGAFSVQTEEVSITHTSIQTNESGSKTTADIVKSCLSEKPDFVDQLSENLEEAAIKQLSEKLLLNTVTDLLMKKVTPLDTRVVLDRLLEHESTSSNDNSKQLSFIRDYLCDKFETKDLLLLCSQILKIVYDKPA